MPSRFSEASPYSILPAHYPVAAFGKKNGAFQMPAYHA